jgi:hypothetical protein
VKARSYRIVVRGRLGRRFGDSFEGLQIEPGPGLTVLRGELVDQAQLYGLLERLRDLALDLVRLEEVEP